MSSRAALWLILYLAWMALLVGGLFWGRETALRVYGGAQAKGQWEEFRQDMTRISEEGPVKRTTPKSAEPPALRLMRDYFGVCLAATAVFGSLLFAMLAGAARGAFSDDFQPRDEPAE